MADRLIRRPEVESLTGLSRSTIYAWIKTGDFPAPVPLGARLVAWRERDVTDWIETRTSGDLDDVLSRIDVDALIAEAEALDK